MWVQSVLEVGDQPVSLNIEGLGVQDREANGRRICLADTRWAQERQRRGRDGMACVRRRRAALSR